MIQTPWGLAYIVQIGRDGVMLVALKKENMTTTHPNYRGGPCVNFLWMEKVLKDE